MHWIIAAPTILALILMIGLFPYGTCREAFTNVLASDGTLNRRRMSREARHLGGFLTRGALLPIALLLVVQVALLMHHHLIGPGAWLASVYGENHPDVALNAPDIEAWTAAYNEEQARLAVDPPPPLPIGKAISKAMSEHWPLYPVYLLLSAIFLGYFFARRYVGFVQGYARGVRKRKRTYVLRRIRRQVEPREIIVG